MKSTLRIGLSWVLMGTIVLMGMFPMTGFAEVPRMINYQGMLTDPDGVPLTGTFTMRFYLYDALSGGNQLWNPPNGEEQAVSVTDGIYNVQLGSVSPLTDAVFSSDTVYLEVVVYNLDTFNWETLSPRQRITSVAYALKAADADNLDGKDSTEFAGAGHTHDAGTIVTGTLSTDRFTAYGDLGAEGRLDNNSDTDVLTRSQADGRYVNEGQAGSITSAMIVDGATLAEIKDDDGAGSGLDADTVDTMHTSDLLDKATYDSDLNSKVDSCQIADAVNVPLALSGSIPSGGIISGTNTHNAGYGVYGESSGADGYGIYGTGNSTYGYLGGYTYAVFGEHIYSDTIGYLGSSSYGVYGEHVGGPNYGYIGGTYHGVYGRVDSGEAGDTAVQGYFSANKNMGYLGGYFYGVYGIHDSSGNWGYIGGTTYAGYFQGNVQVIGRISTGSLRILGGADIAEPFEIRSKHELRPGMVVVIDTEKAGQLTIAEKAYDRRVAGIISGAGGVNTGVLMGQEGSEADGANPVALSGRVYCWGDASTGPIKPGDLLTTSLTPGHAMKVTDYSRAQGAILGKAMSSLERGRGLLLVLVTLQ